MRKISVLVISVVLLTIGAFAALKVKGPPAPQTDSYENYLIIKYWMHQNDFQNALNYIDRYLETHPDDPYILTEKAFLLESVKKDHEAALELLRKAESAYPGYYYATYLHAYILFAEITPTQGDEVSDDPGRTQLFSRIKALLQASIKDNPDFADSLFLLAVVLSENSEYTESNKYFEKVNRIAQRPDTYGYMAFNYRNLKNKPAEIDAYKKILEHTPNNYMALSALAQIYLQNKDYKNASKYLEILFDRHPDNQKLSYEYLYSLFASGKTEKFLELTEKVDIRSAPLLSYFKALSLTQTNKLDEAEKLLLGIEKKDFNTTLLLVDIYLQKRDYYKAYSTIETIKTNTGGSILNPLFYSMKLSTLALLNLNNRILELYRQIKNKKNIVDTLSESDYYAVLFAYVNLNRLENVRKITAIAKEKLKDKTKAFMELSDLLLDFSPEKALEGFKFKFDRNFYVLLTFYKNRKQWDHAVSLINALLKKEQSAEIYLELCDIYQEQGHIEKAVNLLKKLRKQFPDSIEVKNFYAYFLALNKTNLELALTLSAEVLEKEKENPAFLDTYGYVLFQMGRLDEAGRYLERAHMKLPFEEEIMQHLVDYYHRVNQRARILQIYQTAVENGVDFSERLRKEINQLKNTQ
jgi:tetratricopeptide (TPR) repeat protein